jgi:hypothetical protein
MGPGPMTQAAEAALAIRDSMLADAECESVSFVEIDAVNAVKLLMRDGSPRLREAIARGVCDHTVVLTAAA